MQTLQGTIQPCNWQIIPVGNLIFGALSRTVAASWERRNSETLFFLLKFVFQLMKQWNWSCVNNPEVFNSTQTTNAWNGTWHDALGLLFVIGLKYLFSSSVSKASDWACGYVPILHTFKPGFVSPWLRITNTYYLNLLCKNVLLKISKLICICFRS